MATHEQIAAEAYRIWEAEGRPIWGHATDNWTQAIANLEAGLPLLPEVAIPGSVRPAKANGQIEDIAGEEDDTPS